MNSPKARATKIAKGMQYDCRKVQSLHAANKVIAASLFHPGGTLAGEKIPFVRGKYRRSIVGGELPDNTNFVWCEARTDKEGTYYQLMSFRSSLTKASTL